MYVSIHSQPPIPMPGSLLTQAFGTHIGWVCINKEMHFSIILQWQGSA